MSPDHITAGAYNRDIDKRLARIWSGYARLSKIYMGSVQAYTNLVAYSSCLFLNTMMSHEY